MLEWKKVTVGDPSIAMRLSKDLETRFMVQATEVAGKLPLGYGVFSQYDRETNTDTWYFSPETRELGAWLNAQPCEKPVPEEGFSLLMGAQQSTVEHFPDYFKRSR